MSTMAPAPQVIDHAGVRSLLRRRIELAKKHNRDSQARYDRGATVRQQQQRAETQKLFAQVAQNERQASAKKKTAKKGGEGGQGDRRVSSTGDAGFSEGSISSSQVFDIAPQSSTAPVDIVFDFDDEAMKKTMSGSQGYSPHSIASMGHPSSAPLPGQYPSMSAAATPLRGFDQATGFPPMQVDQQQQVLQGAMQGGLQHVQGGFSSEIGHVSNGNQLIGRPAMSGPAHTPQVATPMQAAATHPHPNSQVSSWEPNALGGGTTLPRSAVSHLSHMTLNESSERRQCAPAPSGCFDMSTNQARTLAHDSTRSPSYTERSPKTHTWPRMNGPDMASQSRPLAEQLSDFDEVLWQVQNSDSSWPGHGGQEIQPSTSSIDQPQHVQKGAYYEQATAASSRLCHMPTEVSPPVAMPTHKPMHYVGQHEQGQSHQQSFYPSYTSGPGVSPGMQHGHSQSHSQPASHHSSTPVVPYQPIHASESTSHASSYSQQWGLSQGTQPSPAALSNRIQTQAHHTGQAHHTRHMPPVPSHTEASMPGAQHPSHRAVDNSQLPHGQLQRNAGPALSMQHTPMPPSAPYSGQQHGIAQGYPQHEHNPMLGRTFPMSNSHVGQMSMDVGVDSYLQQGQQQDFANMLRSM